MAVALATNASAPAGPIGIGTRLWLAWLIGSGLPLVGIVITPIVASEADLGVTVPMVFLAAATFVGGSLLTGAAARSITEPVRGVRAALADVADGNLAAALPVDDTGEVGELQRGFNEMVAGLRERERLADLFGRHVGLDVATPRSPRGPSLAARCAMCPRSSSTSSARP